MSSSLPVMGDAMELLISGDMQSDQMVIALLD